MVQSNAATETSLPIARRADRKLDGVPFGPNRLEFVPASAASVPQGARSAERPRFHYAREKRPRQPSRRTATAFPYSTTTFDPLSTLSPSRPTKRKAAATLISPRRSVREAAERRPPPRSPLPRWLEPSIRRPVSAFGRRNAADRLETYYRLLAPVRRGSDGGTRRERFEAETTADHRSASTALIVAPSSTRTPAKYNHVRNRSTAPSSP